MTDFEYTIAGAALVSLLYMLVARIAFWWRDMLWCDGYIYAVRQLQRGYRIEARERRTGAYAQGVAAAELDTPQRDPHVASGVLPGILLQILSMKRAVTRMDAEPSLNSPILRGVVYGPGDE
jgi:hypothetical protein